MGAKRKLTDDIKFIGFGKEWCLRNHWYSLGYTDIWPPKEKWSRIHKINHRNKKGRK